MKIILTPFKQNQYYEWLWEEEKERKKERKKERGRVNSINPDRIFLFLTTTNSLECLLNFSGIGKHILRICFLT